MPFSRPLTALVLAPPLIFFKPPKIPKPSYVKIMAYMASERPMSSTDDGKLIDASYVSTLQSEFKRMVCLSDTPVEARIEDSLRSYWLDRAAQHTQDSYAGVAFSKFPEDLRVYEHLLWVDRPNVVIEIGTHCGASALWFRDRLRTLAAYGLISEFRVVTIDIEADRARPYLDRADPKWEESISLVSGDVRDEGLPDRIVQLLPHAARCLVVEDSAHVYVTTMAALTGFSRFVSPGGFIVVEDGCVDIESMRLDKSWPRGVLPAVADWLAGPVGQAFVARRDLELYGVTCNPGGLLQRRVEADAL